LTSGKQKKSVQQDDFDYFAWWKHAVTSFNISPTEAWKLDCCELSCLIGAEQKSNQDGSFMINVQRKANGMSDEEVLNNGN
tara:strand:- start:36851 stop:37093 length:243 start_codon:yes stop_codon:yes gene_type:complete